jgi:hypothetical protein
VEKEVTNEAHWCPKLRESGKRGLPMKPIGARNNEKMEKEVTNEAHWRPK